MPIRLATPWPQVPRIPKPGPGKKHRPSNKTDIQMPGQQSKRLLSMAKCYTNSLNQGRTASRDAAAQRSARQYLTLVDFGNPRRRLQTTNLLVSIQWHTQTTCAIWGSSRTAKHVQNKQTSNSTTSLDTDVDFHNAQNTSSMQYAASVPHVPSSTKELVTIDR